MGGGGERGEGKRKGGDKTGVNLASSACVCVCMRVYMLMNCIYGTIERQ